MKRKIMVIALVCGAATIGFSPALAGHSWNNYHWARSGDQITPPVDDNVTIAWDSYLRVAINGTGPTPDPRPGWNDSNFIASPIATGSANPRTCKPVAGRIQVCNTTYGQTGWLGVAQIWLSGGHISQGTTKLNDTYFNTTKYNHPEWRRMVMCQELGHDYGLTHTDENFGNYNGGTCMDYTNAPAGGVVSSKDYGPSNEYPNAHDFEMLDGTLTTAGVYSHPDATTFAVRQVGQAGASPAGSEAAGGNSPAEWGRVVGRDGAGRANLFELDLGGGRRKITHVFWALETGAGGQ